MAASEVAVERNMEARWLGERSDEGGRDRTDKSYPRTSFEAPNPSNILAGTEAEIIFWAWNNIIHGGRYPL